MPQQDNAAAKIDHPEKVLRVPFVTDNEAPEVLQPSKQPFNLPTSPIPSQTSQVLCSVLAVTAVRGDQFNSIASQSGIQFVGVVGVVTDQILWSFRDNHLDERGLGQLHFVRRSTFH